MQVPVVITKLVRAVSSVLTVICSRTSPNPPLSLELPRHHLRTSFHKHTHTHSPKCNQLHPKKNLLQNLEEISLRLGQLLTYQWFKPEATSLEQWRICLCPEVSSFRVSFAKEQVLGPLATTVTQFVLSMLA